MNANIFVILKDYPRYRLCEAVQRELWPYLSQNQQEYFDYPLSIEVFSVGEMDCEEKNEVSVSRSLHPVAAIFDDGPASLLRIEPYAFVVAGTAWVRNEQGAYVGHEVYSCPEPSRIGERYSCRTHEMTGTELARHHFKEYLLDVLVTLA
jgi:hypothetical protein